MMMPGLVGDGARSIWTSALLGQTLNEHRKLIQCMLNTKGKVFIALVGMSTLGWNSGRTGSHRQMCQNETTQRDFHFW